MLLKPGVPEIPGQTVKAHSLTTVKVVPIAPAHVEEIAFSTQFVRSVHNLCVCVSVCYADRLIYYH